LINFALCLNTLFFDLKERKNHIIYSWVLLLFFVAGQVILYSHHHGAETAVFKTEHQFSGKSVSEKCGLCDAMRFNSMEINQPVFFDHVLTFNFYFINHTVNFGSVSLISSAGRSPPLS